MVSGEVLTQHDAENVVNAAATSWPAYCKSLSECPNNYLRNLQVIQNAAATVLTSIGKSPVLASLHWLPIKSRIVFKNFLLTFLWSPQSLLLEWLP